MAATVSFDAPDHIGTNPHLIAQARPGTLRSAAASVRERLAELLVIEPGPTVHSEPKWSSSFLAIAKCSWVNLLLVFVIASWSLHFLPGGAQIANADFATSLIALIPLARLLGFVSEDIALRMNRGFGRLFCCSAGNSIELIIAVIACVSCDLRVASSVLIGTILSNGLLVLGICFLAGGTKFSEQAFSRESAQENSSLLVISVIAILIPAAFHTAFTTQIEVEEEVISLLAMSRGIAIILIFIYLGSLFFQHFTHSHLYEDAEFRAGNRKSNRTLFGREFLSAARSVVIGQGMTVQREAEKEEEGSIEAGSEEDIVFPKMNLWFSLIAMFLILGLLVMSSLFFITQIVDVVEFSEKKVSAEWIGLILIPLCANVAEQLGSISTSMKDKLDEAMNLALGKATQLALFVVPLLIVISWGLNLPLTLLFNPFESIVLFLSVLVVTFTLQSGKTNWMSGFLLVGVYAIIATAFWFYPETFSPIETALQCAVSLTNGVPVAE